MHTQSAGRQTRPTAGFSLLETLIALSILLVVFFGAYLVYDAGQAEYSRGSAQWDVQSQGRVAIERMAREIRQAGFTLDMSNPIAYPIVIATNDTISFRAALDPSAGVQYITYGLRNCDDTLTQTLYRNASATQACGGQAIIDSLAPPASGSTVATGLRFTYFAVGNVPIPQGASPPYLPTPPYQLDNQNFVTGTTLPTPAPVAGSHRANIYQVRISLTLQQMVSGVAVPFTINTDVALRNRIP